jgi:hypothetical protein
MIQRPFTPLFLLQRQVPDREGREPGWWLIKDLSLLPAEVREAVEMARDEGVPEYAARKV